MDEFDTILAEPPAEFQAPPEAEEAEQGFPSFRYGPDGQSAVFERRSDVPAGWHDHPGKVKGAPDPSLWRSEKRRSRAELEKALRLMKIKVEPSSSAAQLEKALVEAENRAKMERVRAARAEAPAKPKRVRKARPKRAKAPAKADGAKK